MKFILQSLELEIMTERSEFPCHCDSIQSIWRWNWWLVNLIMWPTSDSWIYLKFKLTSFWKVLTTEIITITLMCGILCFKHRPACYILSFVGKIFTRCNIYSIECDSIAVCNSALRRSHLLMIEQYWVEAHCVCVGLPNKGNMLSESILKLFVHSSGNWTHSWPLLV